MFKKKPDLNIPPAIKWLVVLLVLYVFATNWTTSREKFDPSQKVEPTGVAKIAETLKQSGDYLKNLRNLEVQQLTEGNGTPAFCGQKAKVDYDVFLLSDNTKVLSTKDNKPEEITIGYPGVIRALQLGLAGMTNESRRSINAPSFMAFDDPKFKNEKVPEASAVKIEVEMKSLEPKIPESEMRVRLFEVALGSGQQFFCSENIKVAVEIWDGSGKKLYPQSQQKPQENEFQIGSGEIPYWLNIGVMGIKKGGARTLVIPHELSRFAFGDASKFLESHNIKKDGLLVVDLMVSQ